jgi:hypothetical protein
MKPHGPLRGRDEALATALSVVRRTRVHGASGVVLISGDAGIGNLRSIYTKLGVQSRVQLTNVLRERGELQ